MQSDEYCERLRFISYCWYVSICSHFRVWIPAGWGISMWSLLWIPLTVKDMHVTLTGVLNCIKLIVWNNLYLLHTTLYINLLTVWNKLLFAPGPLNHLSSYQLLFLFKSTDILHITRSTFYQVLCAKQKTCMAY